MVLVDEHVASLAFGADVLAMMIDGGANRSAEFRGHGNTFRSEFERLKVGTSERRGAPPSRHSCKELARQGLGGGGRTKNCGVRT